LRKSDIAIDNGASRVALETLDKLSEEYEKKYFSFKRF